MIVPANDVDLATFVEELQVRLTIDYYKIILNEDKTDANQQTMIGCARLFLQTTTCRL